MISSSSLRLFFITLALSGGLFLLAQVAFSDQGIPRWQPTVIVMDFDDVISIKDKPGFFDWAPMGRLFWRNPKALSLLWPRNFNRLYEKGMMLKKELNGASNIIHAILADLTQEGYGDMEEYLDEIIARAVKPKPIKPMIEHLRELKSRGYMLVGATTQDYLQTQAYRQKMKEKYGVDCDELFDLIVTTRVNHLTPITGLTDGYYPMDNNVIMIQDPKSFKPAPSYFKTVITAIKQYHPAARQFIMTDDKEENLEGAQKAGMETIHFYLPNGSAKKSSNQDLKEAVATWWQTIERIVATA